MSQSFEKTLALAGLVQACSEVRKIATSGEYNNKRLRLAIHSILTTEAEKTKTIYKKNKRLKRGLDLLSQNSRDLTNKDVEQMKMILSCLVVSKRLMKNQHAMQEIAQRLEKIKQQEVYFGKEHGQITYALSALYRDYISSIKPRILVHGQAKYLTIPHNADVVRTFLLSAIRFAILWRQLGGNQWQLIFKTNQIRKQAQTLLDKI